MTWNQPINTDSTEAHPFDTQCLPTTVNVGSKYAVGLRQV